MTHIPTRNGIPYDKLQIVLEAIVRAAHPKVEDVGFAIGTENPEGINAIQFKTGFNKAAQDVSQDILERIFGQKFEISYIAEQKLPRRIHAIAKVEEITKIKQLSLTSKYR